MLSNCAVEGVNSKLFIFPFARFCYGRKQHIGADIYLFLILIIKFILDGVDLITN